MKFYTGIGSRESPKHILSLMTAVAEKLDSLGWTLRSGGADGADTSFYNGTRNVPEIYIPWNGFNGLYEKESEGIFLPKKTMEWAEAEKIVSQIHPAWDRLTPGAKSLHTRNVFQVLGRHLDTPSNFLICYAKPSGDSITGGTRTAYELAKKHSIPCFNLYVDEHKERVVKFVNIET